MNQKPKVYVQLKTDPFHIIGVLVNARARGKRAEVLWPQETRTRVHRKDSLTIVGDK